MSASSSLRVVLVALALTGAARAASPPPYEIPPDRSLLPDEYVKLGVPSYDHPWSGTDLVEAAKGLSTLGHKKPQRLPRYNSERSGLVFSRLMDPENLALYRDKTLPLEGRFQQALAHVQAGNDIHKLYVGAFMKKAAGDSELIELTGGMLRLVAMMFDLVDEMLPTLSKTDPAQAKKIASLDQMKQGFSKVIFGTLRTLAESQTTRAGERIRLVYVLMEILPGLMPRMNPATCAEIRDKIQAMGADPTLADLQPALGELKSLVTALVPVVSASPSPSAAASPAPPVAPASPSPGK